MYNHHVGYANAPVFLGGFFCVWDRVNGHVHQCAHVTPSVSEWGHVCKMWSRKEQQTELLVTHAVVLSRNLQITAYYVQSTQKR